VLFLEAASRMDHFSGIYPRRHSADQKPIRIQVSVFSKNGNAAIVEIVSDAHESESSCHHSSHQPFRVGEPRAVIHRAPDRRVEQQLIDGV
jgi:hypothetical protein